MTAPLPAHVVAASGLGVLCHAPEVPHRGAVQPAQGAREARCAVHEPRGADPCVDALKRTGEFLVRDTEMPGGLSGLGLGFGEADIPMLSDGAWTRQRPLADSPLEVTREAPAGLNPGAGRHCWPAHS
ncbi:MAG: hypothetical protein R3337_11665 [Gammaproteobacteria bacterium]|nr:hypothetical protein [Gammaproteobacteria bacterium]